MCRVGLWGTGVQLSEARIPKCLRRRWKVSAHAEPGQPVTTIPPFYTAPAGKRERERERERERFLQRKKNTFQPSVAVGGSCFSSHLTSTLWDGLFSRIKRMDQPQAVALFPGGWSQRSRPASGTPSQFPGHKRASDIAGTRQASL